MSIKNGTINIYWGIRRNYNYDSVFLGSRTRIWTMNMIMKLNMNMNKKTIMNMNIKMNECENEYETRELIVPTVYPVS